MRGFSNAQAAPPLPPKGSGRISSNGNLSSMMMMPGGASNAVGNGPNSGGALSGSAGATAYRSHGGLGASSGAMAGAGTSGGGIVRHSIGNTSQQNLQSLYSSSSGGNGGSGNNLVGSSGDAALDHRRALHYANQPSSTTSSPALSFLPGHPAVPQALVSLVSMQSVTKARELEQIFLGDPIAYTQAQHRVESLRAQFEHGEQLKEAFGFDEHAFRFLARQYKLFRSGKVAEDDDASSIEPSFADMCAHNALAAFVTGNAHVSQMWRILHVLYESEDTARAMDAIEPIAAETHDGLDHPSNGATTYYTPPPLLHGPHALHPHHHQYLVETRSEDSTSVLSMDTDDHSHHNDTGGLGARKDLKHLDEFGQMHHGPHGHHHNGANGASGAGAANPNQTTMLLEQLDHVNPQALQGFDPYPYDVAGRGRDAERTGTAGANGRKPADASASGAASASSPMLIHGNAVHGELSHLRDSVLKELLEYYADVGDLQTCVAVAAVVSTVTNVEQVMGKAWLQQIYMHYIDLLHQLRIYSAANELVANCTDQSIRQMNMVRTKGFESKRLLVHDRRL